MIVVFRKAISVLDVFCKGIIFSVFESSEKEMNYVLSRSSDEKPEPTRTGSGDYVRLRGLPYQCSREEISQFFEG